MRIVALLFTILLSVLTCSVAAEPVDLFDAKAAGQVEVKLIPKNSTRATVLITNKTDQPLSIELPEVFAGVPVLAQFGGGGGGGGLGIGGGGGGGGQGVGGGGLGGGGGGRGGGGGVFNIQPAAVGKFRVPTVCLEHGKDEPNPRIEYDLVPIETLTSDAKLIAILQMLGARQVDQTSAQAAAWHLTDGLSWTELANKVKVKHLDGSREMYFSPAHLQQAVQIVAAATQQALVSPRPSPAGGADTPPHVSPSAGSESAAAH